MLTRGLSDRICAGAYDPRKCKIAAGVRNSNCAVPRRTKVHPRRPRSGGSASFCALNPMVT
eukprot:9362811-Alexandrium_andersonii.AAC.1